MTTTQATPLPPPALAFALAHNGCLARDLKWRPERFNSSLPEDSVGVLAAALGDGSLALWCVPSEAEVKKKSCSSSSSSSSPPPPLVVHLPPLAVGAGCGLLSAVSWSPRKGDELATAGFDGSALLWRVETAGGDDEGSRKKKLASLVPLLRTPRDAGGPLRCLAFPPAAGPSSPAAGVALSHASGPHSSPALRCFATAGHSPDARLWDASDPGGGCVLARLPLAASRAWVLSMAWLAVPLGLLLAQDGGRLLFLPLDAGSSSGSSSGGASAEGASEAASAAPSGRGKRNARGLNKKTKKNSKRGGEQQQKQQSQQKHHHQNLILCRVAGGAEARDDAVWSVSACPGTATLAAYCTAGGVVGTVDVLPTPGARVAAAARGGGGGGGSQAVVSGFVACSEMVSSPSGNINSSVVVALPLTREMKGLAARAERAAEAEAAAQQRAMAAAAGAAAEPQQQQQQQQEQQPPPPRPVYAERDARLSANCVRFSELESGGHGSSKAWWSALAAGGGLGVVRVHEVDVQRVARGRV